MDGLQLHFIFTSFFTALLTKAMFLISFFLEYAVMLPADLSMCVTGHKRTNANCHKEINIM